MRARGTWVLVIAVMVLGGWILTGHESVTVLQERMGLSRQGLLEWRWWQLWTHAFIHGNGWHAVVNGVLLWVVASRVEWIAGPRVLWSVFLAGVLGGGVLHVAMSSAILVGASGGCLALVLWMSGVSPDSRVWMVFSLRARHLGRGLLMGSLILAMIDPAAGVPGCAVLGQHLVDWGMAEVFQVSHACHLGGALAGWACARWMLRPRVTLEQLQRERAKREGS